MKNFYKKYKSLVYIFVFIVFAIPLFYFVTTLLFKNIQSRADKIQEKIIDNSLEKQKIEKIPQMEEINAEFEKNKDAINSILNVSENVGFIEYIEKLAENTGNEITIEMIDSNGNTKVNTKVSSKSLSSKGKEVEKSLEEKLTYRNYFSMQINLTGDYPKLLNFVHKLENSQNYVNIIALNVKKDLEDKAESLGDELKVGDIFRVPKNSNQDESSQKDNFVLKSSLTVIVYTK
ncbi:MAG: hypothetical protein WAV31_00755 [Candidatus Moraniibacteriota bacterium]